jgi:hypothetical protein
MLGRNVHDLERINVVPAIDIHFFARAHEGQTALVIDISLHFFQIYENTLSSP